MVGDDVRNRVAVTNSGSETPRYENEARGPSAALPAQRGQHADGMAITSMTAIDRPPRSSDR